MGATGITTELHPASSVQRRIRFAELLDPGSTAYLLPVALDLDGALDLAALGGALDDLVARHESLRTEIHDHGGDVGLLVRRRAPVVLGVVDVPAPAVARPDEAARDLCARDAARPLDLGRAPLLRATVIRTGPQRHVLSLVTHHIACDGWSAEIIAADLAALYLARTAGRPAGLPAGTGRYLDFVDAERRWRSGPARADQLRYWRTRLAGISPAVLPGPGGDGGPDGGRDGGRDSGRDSADEYEFTVPTATATALGVLGRELGVSPFMTYLALFGATLTAYRPGHDIAIGTPVANRQERRFEDTVGCFVNTVAVRVPAATGRSARDLLVAVRESVLGAFEHGDVPFDEVVDEVRPERGGQTDPLFRVEFSVPPSDTVVQRFGDVVVRRLPRVAPVAKFDLALQLEQRDGRVVGVLRHRRAVLDRATAARIAAHLLRTAERAALAPDDRLDRVEPTSADDRATLLGPWNGRADGRVEPSTVPRLVLDRARLDPQAVALQSRTRTLTYAELVAAARALGAALAQRGAGPERVVAVCLPHGPDLVVALLAVLLCGAAYQPLDPASPPRRVAELVADTDAVLAVATDTTAAVLPGTLPWLPVDAQGPSTPPEEFGDPDPASAAYVIHTSGTTGRPKGVVVEHRSLGAYVAHCVAAYPALADGAVLHTPVAYDLAVTALWGTLAAGGRLTPVELAEIVERGVAAPPLLKATPGQLAVLDEAVLPTDTLICGGERLLGVDVAAWRRRHPQGLLVNHYGPTETTVGCTDHHVPPGAALPAGDVPVGRPFAHVRAYVLDRLLRLCPVGVPGELYVGGTGVARGYVDQPALTAHRFVADPYGAVGTRMYRTGDVARWDGSGRLVHLGRVDDQVKIRGVRVEPGEVRSAVLDVPAVGSAAVVATGTGATRRLVAYVTPRDDRARADLADAVRTHLAARLPATHRPAHVVVLDRLPLTPHGKLDAARLPAADVPDLAVPPPPRAPTPGPTGTAAHVLALVADLLGRATVTPADDFFELGGNSLLAMRLVGQVRAQLDRELTVAAVFDAATLGDLIELVAAAPAAPTDGFGGDGR